MFHALTHAIACRRAPVYVVAGFMRSGTTAMMQALERGGMHVDRAPRGDPLRALYELSIDQRRHGWYDDDHPERPELPPGERYPRLHRGHVIKALVGSARYMDPQAEPYRVIFMRRSSEEIRASADREFGHPYRVADIERAVESELRRWEMRGDAFVMDAWFEALLERPQVVMQRVRDFGFPIRVGRAAGAIRPELRHVSSTAAGVAVVKQ